MFSIEQIGVQNFRVMMDTLKGNKDPYKTIIIIYTLDYQTLSDNNIFNTSNESFNIRSYEHDTSLMSVTLNGSKYNSVSLQEYKNNVTDIVSILEDHDYTVTITKNYIKDCQSKNMYLLIPDHIVKLSESYKLIVAV
jgi:hypothetical protein